MRKAIVCFWLMVFVAGCGVSEDCIQNSGANESREMPVEAFRTITVFTGVGLVVKQGEVFSMRMEGGKNVLDNIEWAQAGDSIYVKNNMTCNLSRNYDGVTVYITAPSLEQIFSNTDKDVTSDGVLTFPRLRLVSMSEFFGGYGTGEFRLDIQNAETVVEANHVATFYMNGSTGHLICNFYNGLGRFEGDGFPATEIDVFHRGSNDMIVRPLQRLSGNIYSTGNLVCKSPPATLDVQQHYSGHLVLDY